LFKDSPDLLPFPNWKLLQTSHREPAVHQYDLLHSKRTREPPLCLVGTLCIQAASFNADEKGNWKYLFDSSQRGIRQLTNSACEYANQRFAKYKTAASTPQPSCD